MTGQPMEVHVGGVTVAFAGRTVLSGVHLKVGPGERVALLGPSGAGKTTLLRVIIGAVRPAEGEVSIDGADPFGRRADVTRLRRGIGCVRQRDDLIVGLTARTNILAGVAHAWRPTDWAVVLAGGVPSRFAARLSELAAIHDITALLRARVERLSGGERQRVALARALFTAPGLLLADESTSGLDPVRAAVALDHLTGSGATLIATTHDLDVARRFDRVVALRDGQVVHDGDPPDAGRLERIYGTPAESMS
ncbi:ATP-binding cassette domain-containing protein [Herbidospora galbida]|uniref:ATP-binding cassette domain-containing protein n=1 Tax=Herbidospora galbida TaxID=2575442 RepID=A0A4U3MRC1_9ACTN|nr:ATP-binding cassette domain-containing protein [Herbidospora galbida]TKK91344.1 ATP-binding cassette domain-containing protein [Herbidospora galbida]